MRYSVFWFPNSPCFFTDNDTLHALSPPPPLPSFTTENFRPECHQVSSYSLPCCTRNDTSNVPLDAVYFPLRPTSATLSATRHVRAVIPAPHSTSEPPSLLAPTPPRTPLHFHPILPTHSDTTQSDNQATRTFDSHERTGVFGCKHGVLAIAVATTNPKRGP